MHIYVEWLSAACCAHVCACVWSFVAIGIGRSPSSCSRRLVKTKLPLSSEWWAAVGWIPASLTAGGLTFMCAASATDAQVMLQQRRTTAAAVHRPNISQRTTLQLWESLDWVLKEKKGRMLFRKLWHLAVRQLFASCNEDSYCHLSMKTCKHLAGNATAGILQWS